MSSTCACTVCSSKQSVPRKNCCRLLQKLADGASLARAGSACGTAPRNTRDLRCGTLYCDKACRADSRCCSCRCDCRKPTHYAKRQQGTQWLQDATLCAAQEDETPPAPLHCGGNGCRSSVRGRRFVRLRCGEIRRCADDGVGSCFGSMRWLWWWQRRCWCWRSRGSG